MCNQIICLAQIAHTSNQHLQIVKKLCTFLHLIQRMRKLNILILLSLCLCRCEQQQQQIL